MYDSLQPYNIAERRRIQKASASREARNYETHRNKQNNSTIGLVVMKQRNKPWSEAYVVSTLNELLPHL